MIDLAVIGSGPAALTAALYAARLGLKVKVFEKLHFGGALPEISHLANFPGFDGAGSDFANKLVEQVKSAGAEIEYGTCTSVKPLIIDEEEVRTRAVLVATGSEPRPLPFKIKTPVSYCALCDAPLYQGKNIAVVGGGNSALGEALHLASIAKTVTIIAHSDIAAQKTFVDQIESLKNVKILDHTEPTAELLNDFDGVFVFIGKKPATDFLPKSILDEKGFIKTDENYMTAEDGIFAAGDVRLGSQKQAINASAEGAAAATKIAEYLRK